jgi:HAD superfamily hydrolase (TIGR01509 family)
VAVVDRAHPATAASRRTGGRRRPAPTISSTAPRGPQEVAEPSVAIDTLCSEWRAGLDAADDALRAARGFLPPAELRRRTLELAKERKQTLELLKSVARAQGVSPRYLHVLPRRDTRRLLGLPAKVHACVFNLDGVLIGSATLHAAAWTTTFDEFIHARIERTKGQFAPFDPRTDYGRYLHGRPRLEGVRGFLASRGISLPEGTPSDPPGAETVHGLANRKNLVLQRRLAEGTVTAYEGSRFYLQTARESGVRTAVVSASANTPLILEQSGLAPLIDACVDGNTMTSGGLRPKPAPDSLLAAAELLGVPPGSAASFETTPAGVEAARSASFAVVLGIDQFGQAAGLRAAGAAPVVPGLAEILDQTLAA